MIKGFIAKAAATLVLAGSLLASASAAPISIGFSFADDPAAYAYGRTHVGGSVTGILHGLQDNGINLLPTAIEITSNVSWLGMTDTLIDANNSLWFWNNIGFTIVNGVITGGGFAVNFSDPSIGGLQFRINSQDGLNMNILHWNGSSGPMAAIGNTGGLAGVTFSNGGDVPEPASLAMLGLGLAALAMSRKARA